MQKKAADMALKRLALGQFSKCFSLRTKTDGLIQTVEYTASKKCNVTSPKTVASDKTEGPPLLNTKS
jgi:hypothetical protein